MLGLWQRWIKGKAAGIVKKLKKQNLQFFFNFEKISQFLLFHLIEVTFFHRWKRNRLHKEGYTQNESTAKKVGTQRE